ncbi:MAG: hypothetical protein R3247_10780 [Rhodothermales bacterium]|nr:hypothetical protein [Rhodothermales bacterium]
MRITLLRLLGWAVVLGLTAPAAHGQFIVRVAGELSGRHNSGLVASDRFDGAFDTEPGFSVGAAFAPEMPLSALRSAVQVGIGVEHQFGRGVQDVEGDFRFTTPHALARLRYDARVSPFVSGRGGFSLFAGDDAYTASEYEGLGPSFREGATVQLRGFVAYSLGGGVFFGDRFFLEVLWNHYEGSRITRRPVEGDVDAFTTYRTVSLGAGYRLGKTRL